MCSMRFTADTCLKFRNLPPDFKKGEKVCVVQYEFSGIQSFIFGEVNINTSIWDVHGRSLYIRKLTDELEHEIRKYWKKMRTLSSSSGKLICALPRWTRERDITAVSDKLQRQIFVTTEGRLEMYYAYTFASIETDGAERSAVNAGTVLALGVNKNKYHCTNLLKLDTELDHYDTFGIGHLTGESKDRSDRRILASEAGMAVKFDLDNLGAFFQQVTNFDERQAASKALSDALDDAFSGLSHTDKIFVGGDDIFAISKMDHYLQDIAGLYRNITERLNSEPELALYREGFGISAGCSVIRNDLGNTPLLYYFESSEEQLTDAKNTIKKNVISVSGTILTWEQLLSLSDVTEKYEKEIFGGLRHDQRFAVRNNIREMKRRILAINKTGKILKDKEESIIYGIGV